jgi:hypothetical protein
LVFPAFGSQLLLLTGLAPDLRRGETRKRIGKYSKKQDAASDRPDAPWARHDLDALDLVALRVNVAGPVDVHPFIIIISGHDAAFDEGAGLGGLIIADGLDVAIAKRRPLADGVMACSFDALIDRCWPVACPRRRSR